MSARAAPGDAARRPGANRDGERDQDLRTEAPKSSTPEPQAPKSVEPQTPAGFAAITPAAFELLRGDEPGALRAFATLALLLWHQGRNPDCYPGLETLAALQGCSVRAVSDALRLLKDKGLVTRHRKQGRVAHTVVTLPDWKNFANLDRKNSASPGGAGPEDYRQSGVAKSRQSFEGRTSTVEPAKKEAPSVLAAEPPVEALLPGFEPAEHASGHHARRNGQHVAAAELPKSTPRTRTPWPETPANLAGHPGFAPAWRAYCGMRREGKNAVPVGPTSAAALLETMEERGAEWSIAALRHSTAYSYRKLVHPDENASGRGKASRSDPNPARPPAGQRSVAVMNTTGEHHA